MKRSEYALLALAMLVVLALTVCYVYQQTHQPQVTALATTTWSGSGKFSDDLTVTDDTTLGDDVTVTAGWLTLSSETIIPVDAKPITPTQTMVLTNGAANTTNTIAGCANNGRLLYVTNIATYTVTLADSGNWRLAAQIVLGQYDTAAFVCVSTAWSQLATADN